MNSRLALLHPYPFEKLAALLADATPPADKPEVLMSIGEPAHAAPTLLSGEATNLSTTLGKYPLTRGNSALREVIADWLVRRYGLSRPVNPDTEILPVNGSREALFSFIQAVVDRPGNKKPNVVMPNPFYQIYEGAALLAGATPCYLNNLQENKFLPDFDQLPESIWNDTQLLILCSPDNPTGSVVTDEILGQALALAEKHDFIVALDECYSEIYFDENEPPQGLLGYADKNGNSDFRRCVIFQSLSKRSNLPGLRSGFVAGDAAILNDYFRYRTYHGCTLSPLVQQLSIKAWSDEDHVIENRNLYREKFDTALGLLQPLMNVARPDAGFYLWPETPISDTEFTRHLYTSENIKVLPGSFLSRESDNNNPGCNRVRMALVQDMETTRNAVERIAAMLENL